MLQGLTTLRSARQPAECNSRQSVQQRPHQPRTLFLNGGKLGLRPKAIRRPLLTTPRGKASPSKHLLKMWIKLGLTNAQPSQRHFRHIGDENPG
jgi:hypothetical protein